ncbi:TPA: YacL family protein [Vibrio cholerae]|nr:YacL family protein [Vibrio cholerae]
MEFEFIKNTLLGEYAVRCNMEHQIVGRWLQEEIGQDLAKLKHVLTLIDKAEQSPAQEFLWTGREISLLVQGDEITVQENALAYVSEHELETDFALYDSESIAACGREDFVALLTQWQSFIQNHGRF